MRKFEKISEEQYKKDLINNIMYLSYDELEIPKRGTKKSAGYDFISPIFAVVPAKGSIKIPTGIKVSMEDNDVLLILPRSSIGFKTNIRLSNTIGVIDSDYYNNPDNEGHMWIKFYNPTDDDYTIKMGDKIAQGIFTKYETVDDEENIETERIGGFGSTGK